MPKSRGRAGGPGGIGADVTRISKPERLLNLVAFLLSSRQAVPFTRIRGRVAGYDDPASPEALEKRFDRDKAELRALGVPIVYDASGEHGDEGYRIPREQYFLPDVHLTVEEAAALAVVQRYAFAAKGDPLAGALQSALRKVVVDSPLTGAAAASITEQHRLGVRTTHGAPDLGPNLESLTDGVIRHQPVRFRYYSLTRGEVEDRDVHPYGLGWHGSNWYLVGFDRRRDAVRQFRVDRIRGRVRVRSSKPFAVPDEFDVAAHVGRPAFRFGHDENVRVAVELRAETACLFRDDLRDDMTYTERPDGSAVVEFDSNDTAAALRWVARHTDLAWIAAPEEVRDRARENFRAILARHEGPPTEIPGRRAGRGRR